MLSVGEVAARTAAGAAQGRLPRTPVAFHQLLRGPRFRWWRPVLCLLLFAVLVAGVFLLLGLAAFVAGGAGDPENVAAENVAAELSRPVPFLILNVTIAVLLPLAVLSIRLVHAVPVGFTVSVLGRLRWRWLGRCLLLVAPLFAVYLGVGVLVGLLTGDLPAPPPAQWFLLLIVVVATTPFQAAAEEFVFRGWLPQNLGAYVGSEKVGLVVTTVVSAVLFASAHGSFDVWILGDLMAFAVAASVLTWRTGGLEAAIAVHLTNNVLVSVVSLSLGGWERAFVGETTAGSPLQFSLSLVVNALAVLLVWRSATRHRIAQRSEV